MTIRKANMIMFAAGMAVLGGAGVLRVMDVIDGKSLMTALVCVGVWVTLVNVHADLREQGYRINRDNLRGMTVSVLLMQVFGSVALNRYEALVPGWLWQYVTGPVMVATMVAVAAMTVLDWPRRKQPTGDPEPDPNPGGLGDLIPQRTP